MSRKERKQRHTSLSSAYRRASLKTKLHSPPPSARSTDTVANEPERESDSGQDTEKNCTPFTAFIAAADQYCNRLRPSRETRLETASGQASSAPRKAQNRASATHFTLADAHTEAAATTHVATSNVCRLRLRFPCARKTTTMIRNAAQLGRETHHY